MHSEPAAETGPPPLRVSLAELHRGGRVLVRDEAGNGVLVCLLGDLPFAVAAGCPHAGGPLAEGRMEGAVLVCPWHGASFDVRTGALVRGPACAPLRRFDAEVAGGEVVVSPLPAAGPVTA